MKQEEHSQGKYACKQKQISPSSFNHQIQTPTPTPQKTYLIHFLCIFHRKLCGPCQSGLGGDYSKKAPLLIGGSQKGDFQKGGFWRMFPGTQSRNEGTFECSLVPKTETRAHSGVPRYQKPESGCIRQNHPFTKPPFLCFLSILAGLYTTFRHALRLLNALNSEDRGLKVRFPLAMIVFETFELILCQMLSSQGQKHTFKPLSAGPILTI